MTTIPFEYVQETCRIGQGEACCAFLVCGADGFECTKGTPLESILRDRVRRGEMTAQGDNCDGYPPPPVLAVSPSEAEAILRTDPFDEQEAAIRAAERKQ